MLVDDPVAVDLAVAGPLIEAAFAGGINVALHRAHRRRPVIASRVWERGAGITEACGTGATAAAFAAHDGGSSAIESRVAMPGGDAES